MALAFDAHSQSHSGTSLSSSEASFSWTHTPVGDPKGVIVQVVTIDSSTHPVTSVTYGGTALTLINDGTTTGSAVDTASEPGACYVYMLRTAVPTGAQTVVINRTNNSTTLCGTATTVTAGSDVEEAGIQVVNNNAVHTSYSIDDGSVSGTDSLRFCLQYSGKGGLRTADTAHSTTMSARDLGSDGIVAVRETTPGVGARSVGVAYSTADDLASVAFAVRETGVTGGGGGGTTGQIKVWDGTASVAKPVKEWTGAAHETKPTKEWNGSAWVETNY